MKISHEHITIVGFIIGSFIFLALLFFIIKILMMIGYESELLTIIVFELGFGIYISLGVCHAWNVKIIDED